MLQAMNQKGQKGFTLVELMIVVAIIGILAAIAIPQFAQYRIRGFNSSALSDMRNLTTAQEAFFSDWQAYAVTRGGITDALGVTTPEADLAAITGAGTLVTGPSSVNTVIAQYASGAHRQLQIGIGNMVSMVADADATATSYTAVAKHLQGNTIYGADSDASAIYRDQDGITPGVVLVKADNVVPVAQKDDFVSAVGGTWNAM